ncbi:cytochrome P450 [Yoonia sediminilitoris]|uniref:Cytochrome P450 n=1 Tax=Yoonia sediminilitoris TaxID=1286148 RepID=A0A2T6KRB3_9RHOB|nr:cytochrome P450 [Yoonia sediminilitoris]PUB19101.1 cytochrome P450 [Yoonia sediminilitoris]RCW99269.1 cytochrome P450 [Yoonia sediminilitoris]
MKTLRQSPTAPAFVQNPYPFYDEARADGDFFWWDEYDIACAVSHQAVQTVLRSKQMGRECPPELTPDIPAHQKPFYDIEAHSMLELEPPRHTRLRALVLRAFTSRTIAAMEADITQLCHQLIDRFPTQPFDLLDAYARPVPVVVICRLLGVPEEEADNLLAWSNAMVAMYTAGRTRAQEDAASAAARDFAAFMRGYIAKRRKSPANDLISTLIAAEEAGEKLSEDELITTCILLLNAGHEATVHTLGNGVKTLLEQGVRDISEASIEEILRFDPPLHMFTRWVYEDVSVAGQSFKRGDQIACLLAAANRDPAAYDTPNRFDPARKGPQNTSFGGGIHFCVGAPLARLELRIALRVLLSRCPDLRMTEVPRYADVFHFHGLEKLMVTR